MTDTKAYVEVPKITRKISKNIYTKIIRHFKYYHVILLKQQLFHSVMHIIRREWHNTNLAFR